MPRHNHSDISPSNASFSVFSSTATSKWAKLSDGSTYGWNHICLQGNDQPHNNLQPYVVVYRWRRIA